MVFHGQRHCNATHESATDAEARLLRKGQGKEAKLYFGRHGLCVQAELASAKLKTALRTDAACGWDDLIRATADALATVTPEHCTNFFRHAQHATI